jgi:hypothetical protein
MDPDECSNPSAGACTPDPTKKTTQKTTDTERWNYETPMSQRVETPAVARVSAIASPVELRGFEPLTP